MPLSSCLMMKIKMENFKHKSANQLFTFFVVIKEFYSSTTNIFEAAILF